MARPKLDPSGIDNKTPKDKVTVYIPYQEARMLEERWEAEREASTEPKEFIGYGAWLGSLLALDARQMEASFYTPAPTSQDGPSEPLVILDTKKLAEMIADELRPDLSDTLRRSSFAAMNRVGKEAGETLSGAMVEAVREGFGGVGVAVMEQATRGAVLAIQPELRKLAGAVDALTAPVVEWDETESTRH